MKQPACVWGLHSIAVANIVGDWVRSGENLLPKCRQGNETRLVHSFADAQ